MKKINGITQKPHPFQIMSYIFFSALIISYFVIVFPLSSTTARIIGAILEVAFGLAIAISGYLVTAIDPSDSYRCDALKAREEGKSYTPPSTDFRCGIEDVYVHHSSKHCKACGRCTEGFDHHCKWVNNDIGKKNYKPFLVLISNVSLFFVVFIVFGAITTANYSRDPNFTEDGKYLYKSTKENILPAMIILWILMAITSLFFVFVTNLVLLHIFLIKKGLTTFQYITLVEERKQNQRELEIAFKAMGGQNHTCLDFVLCLKKKKRSSVPNPPESKEADNSRPATHPRIYTDKSRTIEKSKSNSDSDSGSNSDSDSDSNSEQSELSEQPEQARVSYRERAIFENMRQTIQTEPIIIQPRNETGNHLAQMKDSKEGNVNNGGFSPVDIENGELMHPLVPETFYIQNKAQETENASLLKNKKLVISLEMIEQRDSRKIVSPKKSAHHDKLLNPIHSFEQGNYYEETLSPFTNRETTSIKKIYESKSAREVSPSQKSLLIQELESAKKIKKSRKKEEAQNSISTQHYSENEIYLPLKSKELNKDNEKKHQELNVEILS